MSLTTLQRTLGAAEHHLSAFLMLGDPTPELSADLAIAAVDAGASMLELGLPFSDPCADGPGIQASCRRARAAGVSTDQAFEILAAIHAARPEVSLNLLVYGNLVHVHGYAEFCRRSAEVGVSTLLVPDIPLEESTSLRAAIADHDLGHVSLVGPMTDVARLRKLDDASSGFLYLAGYQGVTGRVAADTTPDASLRRTVAQVRLPICLGFGICQPEQVAAAFVAGARIVVVGSHLARSIEASVEYGIDRDAVLHAFGAALAPLVAVPNELSNTQTGEARCS